MLYSFFHPSITICVSCNEAIMDYLETHDTIKISVAREITRISEDYRIKSVFGRMVTKSMIEQVPNTRTSNAACRKKVAHAPSPT